MALLLFSCLGLAPKGGGLPGLEGMMSGGTRLPFRPPCESGGDCTGDGRQRHELLATPPQPEPTAVELPAALSPPAESEGACKECARVSETMAAHLVNATISRCLQRCEARKQEARTRLVAVNEEIAQLQAQQLALTERRRQREELSEYKQLLGKAALVRPPVERGPPPSPDGRGPIGLAGPFRGLGLAYAPRSATA